MHSLMKARRQKGCFRFEPFNFRWLREISIIIIPLYLVCVSRSFSLPTLVSLKNYDNVKKEMHVIACIWFWSDPFRQRDSWLDGEQGAPYFNKSVGLGPITEHRQKQNDLPSYTTDATFLTQDIHLNMASSHFLINNYSLIYLFVDADARKFGIADSGFLSLITFTSTYLNKLVITIPMTNLTHFYNDCISIVSHWFQCLLNWTGHFMINGAGTSIAVNWISVQKPHMKFLSD